MSIKGSFLYIFIGIILSILIRDAELYFLIIPSVIIFAFLFIKYDYKTAIIFAVSFGIFLIYKPNYDTLNLKAEIIEQNYTVKEVKDNYLIVSDGNNKYIVYLSYLEENKEIKSDEVISIKGEISKIEESKDLDVFDFSKYLRNKRIYYQIKAYKIEGIKYEPKYSTKIVNKLTKNLTDETLKMVKMLLFNDKYIDEDSYNHLKSINAMHLFVVSGFHISFFFNLICLLFKKNKSAGEAIGFIICFIYAYILSFPISATRAVISLFLYRIFKDYINKMDCVVLPGIMYLFIDPMNIYSNSFILTFIMTITITFCSSFLNNVSKIASAFIISFICFVAMLPIQLLMNYEINFISLLTNIFLSYVVMVIFILSIISILISSFNGNAFGVVFNYFNSMIEKISSLNTTVIFGKMPVWLMVIYYIVFLLIIVSFEKKSYNKVAFFTCVIGGLLVGLYNRQLLLPYQEVTFLNVYQGDCCIIQDSRGGGVLLIDTGGLSNYDIAEKKIIPFLKCQGIRKIDKVVITHSDSDHCGALESLKEKIEICEIIDDPKITDIDLGKIHLTNLNKYFSEKSEDNDQSIVLYGEIAQMYFLFTGDASSNIEKRIIANEEINVDVLKVGHHGSNTSTCEEFIKEITPKYAIISVGANNKYGHPHQSVLEILDKYNVTILRTDQNGTIRFKGKIFGRCFIDTPKCSIIYTYG